MASKVLIYDPTKKTVTNGYADNGVTYADEALTTPVATGTIVRADNGDVYSKGANGSTLMGNQSAGDFASQWGGIGSGSGGGTSTGDQYIRDMYDQQTKASTDALTSAYNQNVLAANAAKAAIPDTYNTARNTTAAQSETQRHNFNEYAAAHGLNSGTGGQAQLAYSNQLQGNLSNLDKQQAKDTSAVDLQIAQLSAKYQGDIASAIAQGKFQTAQALYNKMVQDEAYARTDAQNAQTLAAQQDETNYNRTAAAASASGIYDGMAAYGWTPAQIAAANAAARVTKTATRSSGGGSSSRSGSGGGGTTDNLTAIYQAIHNSGADPTAYLAANTKLSAAEQQAVLNGYNTWATSNGYMNPTTGKTYSRTSPDALVSAFKSDARQFGIDSDYVKSQLADYLASGRIDESDLKYILGQLGLS